MWLQRHHDHLSKWWKEHPKKLREGGFMACSFESEMWIVAGGERPRQPKVEATMCRNGTSCRDGPLPSSFCSNNLRGRQTFSYWAWFKFVMVSDDRCGHDEPQPCWASVHSNLGHRHAEDYITFLHMTHIWQNFLIGHGWSLCEWWLFWDINNPNPQWKQSIWACRGFKSSQTAKRGTVSAPCTPARLTEADHLSLLHRVQHQLPVFGASGQRDHLEDQAETFQKRIEKLRQKSQVRSSADLAASLGQDNDVVETKSRPSSTSNSAQSVCPSSDFGNGCWRVHCILRFKTQPKL